MTNLHPELKFFFKRLVVGPLEVNCYIIADPAAKDACLIDPGAEGKTVKDILHKEKLNLKFIINTHGHGDHIGANSYFSSPIYIHRLDADFLTNPDLNLSSSFMFGFTSPGASRLLEDGDELELGSLRLEVIHTPGHTPGSVSVKVDGLVFTGDSLFAGGVGRTDFSYGDSEALLKSIRRKLFILEDDTVVYPGHGEPSTIGKEKRTNPFL